MTLGKNFLKTPSRYIRCECGAIFLLIPNVGEMGYCIEAHADSHRKKVANSSEEGEFNRIVDHLIDQVFQIVGGVQ